MSRLVNSKLLTVKGTKPSSSPASGGSGPRLNVPSHIVPPRRSSPMVKTKNLKADSTTSKVQKKEPQITKKPAKKPTVKSKNDVVINIYVQGAASQGVAFTAPPGEAFTAPPDECNQPKSPLVERTPSPRSKSPMNFPTHLDAVNFMTPVSRASSGHTTQSPYLDKCGISKSPMNFPTNLGNELRRITPVIGASPARTQSPYLDKCGISKSPMNTPTTLSNELRRITPVIDDGSNNKKAPQKLCNKCNKAH